MSADEKMCFCGYPVFGDDAHPCCEFWRSVIESGKQCPACVESRRARRGRGRQ